MPINKSPDIVHLPPGETLVTRPGDVLPPNDTPIQAPTAIRPVPAAGLGETDKAASLFLGADKVTVAVQRQRAPQDSIRIPPPPAVPFFEAIQISGVASLAEELQERKSADTLHTYEELTFAFALEGVDDDLAGAVSRYVENFRLVEEEPPIWAFTISGERQTWRFEQVRKLIFEKAVSLQKKEPGYMAWGARVPVHKARGNDDVIDSAIRSRRGIFANCVFGKSVLMDGDAVRIAFGDRNKTYVTPKISGTYDGTFQPVLLMENVQLQPGGSEHQYMRDVEMHRVLEALRKWYETADFTALTVEGSLRIGKSRLILEVIKEFSVEFPDVIIGFVPAMDAEKNMPKSYFGRYVRKILEVTRHVSYLSSTEEFEILLRYARDSQSLSAAEAASVLGRYISFFQDKPGFRALIFQDDIHWEDPESQDLFARVFRDKRLLGSLANVVPAREGDEPMPPKLLQVYGIREEDRIRLKLLKFLDDRGEPVPEYKKFVCELLGFDVNSPGFDVSIGDSTLILLAEKSDGNPGILEGLVKEAMRTKALVPHSKTSTVEVNMDALRALKSAGEADSALQNEVERFVADPHECSVLAYIMVLSEIGNCTSSLLDSLFRRVFQQPELFRAYQTLCEHKNIFSQDVYTDEVTISRTGRFFQFFRSRVGDAYFGHIYGRVADVFHRLREISDGKMIVNQSSAYNIYRCADQAGNIDLKNRYCFDAFDEGYEKKDYLLMLSVYKYIKTQPELSAKALVDKEFVLCVLEAMYNVLGAQYIGEPGKPGEYLDLAESLHNLLGREVDETGNTADFARLCDLMIGLSYWRTFTDPLHGMEEIYRWTSRYEKVVIPALSNGTDGGNRNEILFARSYYRYPMALLDYLSHQFIPNPDERKAFFARHTMNADDGIDDFLGAHEMGDVRFLHDDPRYIRMRAEVLRLHANIVMIRDVYAVEVDDGRAVGTDSTISAHMLYKPLIRQEPNNRAYLVMKKAYDLFQEYLRIVSEHPERMGHRNARYMAVQAAGRTAAMVGEYVASWNHFTTARNLAHNAGDYARLGEFTIDVGMVIQYLVENLLADSSQADKRLWSEARRFYAAVTLDYPQISNANGGNPVQALLECGKFFLRKGIDTSRENQKLLAYNLGRITRVENAAAMLENTLVSGDSPDVSDVAADIASLHSDFNALLAFEKTPKSRKEYWSLHGIPAIAGFVAALHRSPRHVTLLNQVVDGLKSVYDVVDLPVETWVLDGSGKPIPDDSFDVPVMKNGKPWIDERTGVVVLKSYKIDDDTGLPYMNSRGFYVRSPKAYLMQRRQDYDFVQKKRIGNNTVFYNDVLAAIQDNFGQSFTDVRYSIPVLAVKLHEVRENLFTLMRYLSPFDDETDAIQRRK